jgi:hypothetical protein
MNFKVTNNKQNVNYVIVENALDKQEALFLARLECESVYSSEELQGITYSIKEIKGELS